MKNDLVEWCKIIIEATVEVLLSPFLLLAKINCAVTHQTYHTDPGGSTNKCKKCGRDWGYVPDPS